MKVKNIGKEGIQLPDRERTFITLRPGETTEWEGDKTTLTPWLTTKALEIVEDADAKPSETKPPAA